MFTAIFSVADVESLLQLRYVVWIAAGKYFAHLASRFPNSHALLQQATRHMSSCIAL